MAISRDLKRLNLFPPSTRSVSPAPTLVLTWGSGARPTQIDTPPVWIQISPRQGLPPVHSVEASRLMDTTCPPSPPPPLFGFRTYRTGTKNPLVRLESIMCRYDVHLCPGLHYSLEMGGKLRGFCKLGTLSYCQECLVLEFSFTCDHEYTFRHRDIHESINIVLIYF